MVLPCVYPVTVYTRAMSAERVVKKSTLTSMSNFLCVLSELIMISNSRSSSHTPRASLRLCAPCIASYFGHWLSSSLNDIYSKKPSLLYTGKPIVQYLESVRDKRK